MTGTHQQLPQRVQRQGCSSTGSRIMSNPLAMFHQATDRTVTRTPWTSVEVQQVKNDEIPK
jgi:hypothetical protein